YLNQIIVLIFFDIVFKRFSGTSQFVDTLLVLAVSVILFFVCVWTYNHIEKRFMGRLEKENKNVRIN
ncbi:MAG: hypothetical protein ABI683_13375, partial [Ginsengibacter sp.]